MPTPTSWPTRLPLVAILRGVQPDEALVHGHALVSAGFDCIEVPSNSPSWPVSVARLAQGLNGQALVGAGTVLSQSHINALCEAGGSLMVMPHTDEVLIQEGLRRGLYVVSGFATASEAFAGIRAGSHALKLFPATDSGLETLRALRAVLPVEMPVLAVGGVKPDNLQACVAAGCQGAGLGSDLYRPGQSPTITHERAAAFVQAWHSLMKP